MKEFKIVGFINSSEIWSTLYLGSSTAGDGTLASYGIVSSSAFADNSNTLARIRYDRLKKISPFSDVYSSKINHYQDELDKLLEDNGQERLRELKKKPQEKVNQSKQALTAAKEQLQEQTRALTSASPDQQQLVQRSLAQARQTIAQKEQQIQEAQAKIDAMPKPTYTTSTRSTMLGGEGYTVYSSNADSMGNLGNIFPIVLYAVAALVTYNDDAFC